MADAGPDRHPLLEQHKKVGDERFVHDKREMKNRFNTTRATIDQVHITFFDPRVSPL